MCVEHTKEPWTRNGMLIEAEHGYNIAEVINTNDYPENEANARRIVACVNACAGISTDDLERHYGAQGGIDEALEEAALRDQVKVIQQRDKLLTALNAVVEWDKARGFTIPYRVRDPILAAITEVEAR